MYKAESFSRFALTAWIPQVIKFSLVGILNTLLDAGIYLILTAWLGFGAFPVLAKGIAYSIGISNSFIMNRSWTFDSDTKVGRSAGIFILAQIAALGINTGGWNFVINKLAVFRR